MTVQVDRLPGTRLSAPKLGNLSNLIHDVMTATYGAHNIMAFAEDYCELPVGTVNSIYDMSSKIRTIPELTTLRGLANGIYLATTSHRFIERSGTKHRLYDTRYTVSDLIRMVYPDLEQDLSVDDLCARQCRDIEGSRKITLYAWQDPNRKYKEKRTRRDKHNPAPRPSSEMTEEELKLIPKIPKDLDWRKRRKVVQPSIDVAPQVAHDTSIDALNRESEMTRLSIPDPDGMTDFVRIVQENLSGIGYIPGSGLLKAEFRDDESEVVDIKIAKLDAWFAGQVDVFPDEKDILEIALLPLYDPADSDNILDTEYLLNLVFPNTDDSQDGSPRNHSGNGEPING